MLYSDDAWLIGRTKKYEISILLHLFIMVLVGAPMAWHKLGGGLQSEWFGYALDVGRFEIGVGPATRSLGAGGVASPFVVSERCFFMLCRSLSRLCCATRRSAGPMSTCLSASGKGSKK